MRQRYAAGSNGFGHVQWDDIPDTYGPVLRLRIAYETGDAEGSVVTGVVIPHTTRQDPHKTY